MSRDLRELMQHLSPFAGGLQQIGWQPSVDIYRTKDGWLIKFELAGVRPEDLDLRAVDQTLVLRGVRYDWSAKEAYRSYSMEISYNQFERSVRMPCTFDASSITTEYRDGMLLVRIPCEETEL